MSLPASTLYAAQPAFRPPPRSRVLNMNMQAVRPAIHSRPAVHYTPPCPPPGLAAARHGRPTQGPGPSPPPPAPPSLGNGLFGSADIWGQDVPALPMSVHPAPYPLAPQKADYGRRRPQSQAAYMAAAQRSAGIENRIPRWDARGQYATRPPSPSRGPRDNWGNGRQPRGRRQSTPNMPYTHPMPPRYHQGPPSPGGRARAAAPKPAPVKAAPPAPAPAPTPRSSPPPPAPAAPLQPITNTAQGQQPAHIGFQNADKLTRAKVVAALLLYRDAGGRACRTRARPAYTPSCLSRAVCVDA
ncbi:hypothetical protein HDZ31DRAFT_34120 [Schizophyllum fasciatum]